MDLDEMISRATAEIEEVEGQLRAAQARLGELVTIRERLNRAQKRYAQGTDDAGEATRRATLPDPLADDGGVPLADAELDEADDAEAGEADVAQTDLVIRAMGELGKTTTAIHIREKLAAQGHELTTEQVRSALGYLKRKGRVTRPRHGIWRLPRTTAVRSAATRPAAPPAASPAVPTTSLGPAASTTGPDQAGENGTSSQADVLTGAGLNSHPARQAPF